MSLSDKVSDFSIRHYKMITVIMVLFTVITGALIPMIKVDTDPENMLAEDEPVRVFHDHTKEEFTLSDIVVLGIVNTTDPNGVFNARTLQKVYELTEFSRTLRWPNPQDPNKQIGVIEVDLMAPSTVDHIGQGGPGEVTFEWLMNQPPQTDAEAYEIKQKAMSNPLLRDTIIAGDGKAIALYLPLTSKDLSYRVYTQLREKIDTFDGSEAYHITGLPVAEDTFGVEMFVQMAISAPLAMLVIFILMLIFFRKLVLIISPMIIAMVSVISTMGLLIGFGFPVHIMSSMIPIFLMPIAVVDSIHILSEFFDRYTNEKGRAETIREVIGSLFVPMLYTSLTSAAGFASLALTPIPPVQVFGIFVALGIMLAWLFTVTFVPAYTMMIPEKSLAHFGLAAVHDTKQSLLVRLLHRAGKLTYDRAKWILALALLLIAVSIYGITRIEINDNPVKWFSKSHPIRQADIALNAHFAGTYMAYLVLEDASGEQVTNDYVDDLRNRLLDKFMDSQKGDADIPPSVSKVEQDLLDTADMDMNKPQFLDTMIDTIDRQMASADDQSFDLLYDLMNFFELEKERIKIFKQPQVLRYIVELENYLDELKVVGKVNSVADVVRKVHQELIDGKKENYRIPDSAGVIAESLLQFQNSHNPDDLWHFVTPDYGKANLWLQLSSGDNKDMEQVVKAVDRFFSQNKPPVPITHRWAGLTYINTVWQDKMVWGMLQAFLGSFLIVFIMMSILFRSPLWGLVCMVPLTITIALIYGVIGLVGKDYDMPVAVLSALTLGMAVDFAIHFLERARMAYIEKGSWQSAADEMFGEPARAISRNVLVISVGFLPLLAAPLIPYKTVGFLLCAIMVLSGTITLMILPAILRVGEKPLFKSVKEPLSPTCNCVFCIIISISGVALVALNLHQFAVTGWTKLAWFSGVAIVISAVICSMYSRRRACKKTSDQYNQ